MRLSKGLIQAYELQDLAHSAALAIRKRCTVDGEFRVSREDAQAITALIKAWEAAQYRIQVHRKVPNPGSLKHVPVKPVRKGRSLGAVPRGPIEVLPGPVPEPVEHLVDGGPVGGLAIPDPAAEGPNQPARVPEPIDPPASNGPISPTHAQSHPL